MESTKSGTDERDYCVYSVLHQIWLKEASKPHEKDPWFCSGKSWATADNWLAHGRKVRILFRAKLNDDQEGEPVCSYEAELIEINLREKDDKRPSEDILWLQHEYYLRESGQKGETEFQRREIKEFENARTYYKVHGMHMRNEVFPITALRKLKNNKPLAANFKYTYTLCWYPTENI